MAATIDELTVADAPEAWSALGFDVAGDVCVVGDVRIRLAGPGAGRGLAGWSLRDVVGTELDGLPTTQSDRQPPGEQPVHPNGVITLDHVVVITPALERTVTALQGAGLDLRRIREEPTPAGAPRQAFFRLGTAILEVVQEPPEAIERAGIDRPAFFWGLAFVAPDLDATVARLEDAVSEVRPAVQPGRRIATLRRSAGLAVPIALITPHQTPGFTLKNLKEVERSTSAPPGLEARVARAQLDSEHLGVSYFRYEPGVQTPFGHSHGEQEEAYVVIAGSGRAKLDEEIVELRQWDVIRIAPWVVRALEGGPAGLELIAIGSDRTDGEDGRTVEDFWSD